MIRSLTSRLRQYDPREARSIVLLLLQEVFDMSLTDVCSGALDSLSDDDKKLLERLLLRLEQGEPVQYVVGHTTFCNNTFNVRKGCLIPRPETEELCYWIKDMCGSAKEILDIGTGSGCIAVSLKRLIDNARVTAWDISEDAIAIAKENADLNKVEINFELRDALAPPADEAKWDVIVSNPPYICRKESEQMERNVLDYEPENALFVPDETPLLFYTSIIRYARKALKPHGKLFFEINPIYAKEVADAFSEHGFSDVEKKKDFEGRERMVCGVKKSKIRINVNACL